MITTKIQKMVQDYNECSGIKYNEKKEKVIYNLKEMFKNNKNVQIEDGSWYERFVNRNDIDFLVDVFILPDKKEKIKAVLLIYIRNTVKRDEYILFNDEIGRITIYMPSESKYLNEAISYTKENEEKFICYMNKYKDDNYLFKFLYDLISKYNNHEKRNQIIIDTFLFMI